MFCRNAPKRLMNQGATLSRCHDDKSRIASAVSIQMRQARVIT